MRLKACGRLLAAAFCAHAALAQRCPQVTEVGAGNMPSLERFNVRTVSVTHPFSFLPWIRQQLISARAKLTVKANQPFRIARQVADREMLQNEFQWPANTEGLIPIRLDAIVATVSNCRDGKLDVQYGIFSTEFIPHSESIEARQKDLEHPETAVKVAPATRFQFTPSAGYNGSDGLFGGGYLHIFPREKLPAVQSLDVLGQASASFADVALAINGSPVPKWPGTSSWRIGYRYRSVPVRDARIQESRAEAQLLAGTRPLGSLGIVFRAGGQGEVGHSHTDFRADAASDALASTGYASARVYSGATFTTKHVAFSSSYGFEAGANGGLGADWTRQLGDVAWNLWFPVGDHRPLRIETRFTAGGIGTAAGKRIPTAKRFFGGNVQEAFVAGDDWDLRANPVLRSIPARQYSFAGSSVGAEKFYAFNSTFAPVAWRLPLISREFIGDPGFGAAIQRQWDVSAAFLTANEMTKDPHYWETLGKLPGIQKKLSSLTALLAVQSPGDPPADSLAGCEASLRLANRRVAGALNADKSVSADVRFGFVAALVSEGQGKVLAKVLNSCGGLTGSLRDALQALSNAIDELETGYGQIDRTGAAKAAARQLVYPRRVFDTIVRDTNLWSLSPVAIFDAARLWPEKTPGDSLRYALGGGIRVTLVSYANLTAGYAVNVHRGTGEGRGALFFSIDVTQILR